MPSQVTARGGHGEREAEAAGTKLAIVVGSTGQDGFYLSRLLAGRGCDVVGLGRDRTSGAGNGPDRAVDIEDKQAVDELIGELRPAEVYYLAAYHRSSQEAVEDAHTCFSRSLPVHVHGLLNFLDAIARRSLNTRLFYAASSHIFGDPQDMPQTESTPLAPICTYGITKACGVQMCRMYRRDSGLFCSVGILYNHESPRRSPVYVTRRIVRGAVAIKRGVRDTLMLGDLDAAVDWGAAVDYVEAMTQILSLDQADDFVVATGKLHTVGEFAEIAFRAVDLDSRRFVVEDRSFTTKASRSNLVGDSSKLRTRTGWKPTLDLEEIVHAMVTAELALEGP